LPGGLDARGDDASALRTPVAAKLGDALGVVPDLQASQKPGDERGFAEITRGSAEPIFVPGRRDDGAVGSFAPAPILQADPDADHRRRSEIEAEMHKPRAENRYWREPAMQEEYRDILGRMDAPRPPLPPRPGDPARKAEIEAAMREGRFGPYWRPGSTLPGEYRALLEREMGQEREEDELA
jgi:hypothetical protein